jgi:7-cyano-7-deazaguanine synthase
MKDQGLNPIPLFINYGQLNCERELFSLRRNCTQLGVGQPIVLDFHDFGLKLATGLTNANKHVVDDAFTPGRNLLFIITAAAFGYKLGVDKIVMGLLSQETILFPDQTDSFLAAAENAITEALGISMKVIVPLRGLVKAEVVKLGQELGVTQFYSCHSGTEIPCGQCIACKEYGE